MRIKALIISLSLALCLLLSACEDREPGTEKGEYFFVSLGVAFTVGDDADRVIGELGEPNSVSKAPSCAGEGQDELYIYNGFRIYAHRNSHSCLVSAIELTNDTVATPEGVRIGDKSERISEIYGEGEKNKGSVEYVSEGCRVRFILRDGKVTMIKYLENDG